MGVALAGMSAFIAWAWSSPQWLNPSTGEQEAVGAAHLIPWIWSKFEFLSPNWGLGEDWWAALPLIPFVPLAIWLWLCARRRLHIKPPSEPLQSVDPGPAPAPVPPPAWAPSEEDSSSGDLPAPIASGELGLSGPAREADQFESSSAEVEDGFEGEHVDQDHQEGDDEPDAPAPAGGLDGEWSVRPVEEADNGLDQADGPDDWPPPTSSV